MLHAGEGAAHLLDGFHRYLAPDGSCSCQQVFNVVEAPQLHIFLGQEGGHNTVLCHAQHPVAAQESAVVGLPQPGKPDLLTLAVGLHGPGDVVLIAQHGAAGRHLMDQDVPLGVDVLLHILVVVQVVGGHIGDHSHLGALAHANQLEAGQLHHSHIIGRNVRQHGQQGCADVAA